MTVQQRPNGTSTDRTQHSAVSKLELQVRYTTTLWGWMHDMKYELPAQRKWPHGVHPPGNASTITTPTMEKLAVQENHTAEQKEVSFETSCGNSRNWTQTLHLDRPAFRFGRVLRYKVTVIALNEPHVRCISFGWILARG